MIKRLYLSNCFTHKNREFIFQNGVTAITGPNESGKSLIPEMVRYCLFGVDALRGTKEDYKKLVAELDFEVHGQLYRVHRDARKTTLQIQENGSWTDYATSINPVNKKITEILGYERKVFDVANCVVQGEVEALGKMVSADRKKMVDQTIGLNVIDDLIKWVGGQYTLANREAVAIEKTLSRPVEPEKPADYQPSQKLRSKQRKLKALVKEKAQIIGWLSNKPKQPTEPRCNVTETAVTLRVLIRKRNRIVDQKRNLESLLKQLPKSKFTSAELKQMSTHLALYRKWEHKRLHLAKGMNVCPKCGHKWPVALDALKGSENVKRVKKPSFDEADLRGWQNDLKLAQQRAGIKKKLKSLAIPKDRSSDFYKRQEYEKALAKYEKEKRTYDKFMAQYRLKQKRLTDLATVEDEFESVNTSLVDALTYEQGMETFARLMQQYGRSCNIIKETKELARQYELVKKALQNLKLRVKGHLVPSLNGVSSYLLSEMTGGVRNQIEIDEEFNIKVDGQPLPTLSGSGKAVANLAIRIGLGQVLTNKVFSVFMADEIDASMDDERAEYTARCLRRLSNNIAQIYLVSHKRPEADHYIDLSESSVYHSHGV